jgi:hypothetical protein
VRGGANPDSDDRRKSLPLFLYSVLATFPIVSRKVFVYRVLFKFYIFSGVEKVGADAGHHRVSKVSFL